MIVTSSRIEEVEYVFNHLASTGIFAARLTSHTSKGAAKITPDASGHSVTVATPGGLQRADNLEAVHLVYVIEPTSRHDREVFATLEAAGVPLSIRIPATQRVRPAGT